MKRLKQIAEISKVWLPPLLLSVFPTLVIYSHNATMLSPLQLVKPVLYSILFAAISACIAYAIFRERNKASTCTSIWVLLFFSYGYIYLKLGEQLTQLNVAYSANKILVTSYLLILVFFGWLIYRSKRVTKIIHSFLLIIGLVLVLINMVQILPFEVERLKEKKRLGVFIDHTLNDKSIATKPEYVAPDIYYIIFDRYARDDILQTEFDFDNSSQIQYLQDSGFFVGQNSNANYLSTYLSLASSLNMTHLDFFADILGENQKDQQVVYSQLIQLNLVTKFLKSQGYSYILAGSFWDPTKSSALADENANLFSEFDEFHLYIYERTLLNALMGMIGSSQIFSGVERLTILSKNLDYQLHAIKRQANESKPKFVLAHFLMPHEPTTFSAECEPLTFDEIRLLSEIDGYIGEVQCSNSVMRQMTEHILSNSERPVVIIFQSDEGAFPVSNFMGDNTQVDTNEHDSHRTHAAILNAIYLTNRNNPEEHADYEQLSFSENSSPVNTFRIILNYYFGSQLPLLENATYYADDEDRPYVFEELNFVDDYDVGGR